MCDRIKSALDCFDEMFNDNFIEHANEEEIENRFHFLRDVCDKNEIEFNNLIDELEFNCNSFITAMVSA